jgi:hypothetical protein
MNGYSLIFAVVVIVTIAVISGAVVMGLIGARQLAMNTAWRRKSTRWPFIAHHRG